LTYNIVEAWLNKSCLQSFVWYPFNETLPFAVFWKTCRAELEEVQVLAFERNALSYH
jgi:hypothetical protein